MIAKTLELERACISGEVLTLSLCIHDDYATFFKVSRNHDAEMYTEIYKSAKIYYEECVNVALLS